MIKNNIENFAKKQIRSYDTILVDLHMHTNVPGSDGDNSPEKLIGKIEKCRKAKIKEITKAILAELKTHDKMDFKIVEKVVENEVFVVISIQDHNTMGAYYRLKDSDIPEYMKIIPGCEVEINVPEFPGLVMDITTYNLDKDKFANTPTGKKLKKIVRKKPAEEKKAFNQLYQALIKDGITPTCKLKKMYEESSYNYSKLKIRANDVIIDEVIQNSSNVEILNNKKLGFDIKKARNTWYRRFCCNPKARGYFIDQTIGRPTLEELARDVKDSGGFAILAHPTAYPFEVFKTSYSKVADMLLDKNCLAGLELVYRSLISGELAKTTTAEKIIRTLYKKCKERDLIYTLSSDFHKDKPGQQKLFHVIDDKFPISYRYIHPIMFNNCDRAVEIIKNKVKVKPLTPEIKNISTHRDFISKLK